MKKNINLKFIIMMIFILLLIIINSVLIIKKMVVPQQKIKESDGEFNKGLEVKNDTNNKSNNAEANQNQTNIQSMSEYERMQYYFAQYVTYIEDKEYEKAYNLLYQEFKDTYFPTLESYTEYVKKLYPKFVSIEYDDFTRQGYVYILTVKIIDPINGSKETAKTQRIILKENDFYDYVLSFQVI